MSSQALTPTKRRTAPRARLAIAFAAVLVLIAAMALDTKVVKIGSAADAPSGAFVPATYGASEFPKVQAVIESRAVDAATLAAAIAKDPAAAAKQYGVASTVGTELPVRFTGTVGKGDFGNYEVKVDGVPDNVKIQVQTGPAIMGTDLRDAPGTISFEQFTNQIDYQNAGSAINKQMKKEVLSKIDTSNLTGKAISVIGAFQLSDPSNWLVTPVKLTVQ